MTPRVGERWRWLVRLAPLAETRNFEGVDLSRIAFRERVHFAGRVLNCSGVWRWNSKWWDRSWRTEEWDVEVEDNGVYRLCNVNRDWFLSGEYD